MTIELFYLLLGLGVGSLILGIIRNLISAISFRETEEEKQRAIKSRERLKAMPRNNKLLLVGVGVAAAVGGAGLLWSIFQLVTVDVPGQTITGYYPPVQTSPESVGMYLGISILFMVIRLVGAVDLLDEDEAPQTIRQVLRNSISVPGLIDAFTMPVMCYIAIMVGLWKIAIPQLPEGINPVEFVGIVKTFALLVWLSVVLYLSDEAVKYFNQQRTAIRVREAGGTA